MTEDVNFTVPANVNQITDKGILYNRVNNNAAADGAFSVKETPGWKKIFQADGKKVLTRKAPPVLQADGEKEERLYLYQSPTIMIEEPKVVKRAVQPEGLGEEETPDE